MSTNGHSPLPSQVEIAIVGAGVSGIGMAGRLRQCGFDDFVVLERSDDVGGTWRDNTYPGLTCDVPARLYSLSFAQNPNWTRSFAPQPEICDYLRDSVRRLGVADRIRLRHEVTAMDWDPDARLWRLGTSHGPFSARFLVLAAGVHSEPVIPDIPGLDEFEGTVFHSFRWNHDHDLRGSRTAVIGTGASAVQFIPRIQPVVGHMTVFQRTPGWILPRWDRRISPSERALMRRFPGLLKLIRSAIYLGREATLFGFVDHPQVLGAMEAVAKAHLRWQVRDPELRHKLTPDFRLGCKRVIISNDYYPALTRPNVELAAGGPREVRPRGVVGTDGVEHEADTIIFGTGYRVTDPVWATLVRGRNGVTLADKWERESFRAYLGTTVTEYPNLFLLHGPNTGLGQGSQIFMIETQIAYVIRALRAVREHDIAAIEPRAEVQDTYNDWLDRRLEPTVWATGCASWYMDHHGRPSVVWPDYSWKFRQRTLNFDITDYEIEPLILRDTLNRRPQARQPDNRGARPVSCATVPAPLPAH